MVSELSNHHKAASSRRWQAIRRVVFDLDGYRCRVCGLPGALECDHITPLHRGGDPWDLNNLQTLCRKCHIAKTAAEGRARRVLTPAEVAWRDFAAELR